MYIFSVTNNVNSKISFFESEIVIWDNKIQYSTISYANVSRKLSLKLLESSAKIKAK